jgi:hypothetical protein
MAGEDMIGMGALGALIGAALVAFLVLAIVVYVYMAIALMTIAKKTGKGPAWLAWIPIANLFLMVNIAGLEWWWVLLLLLGLIPFIGWLIVLAWMAYVWYKIAEARKYPGWVGLLVAIPVVNLIVVGVLAWKEYK